MDKIKQTKEYLDKKLDESPYFKEHPEGKKYRYEHSIRVANIGKEIAVKEGFDVEAMTVACLLHDVSYCEAFKENEDWKNHGRNAARIARPFIESLGFEQSLQDDMIYGIAIHVDDKADFEGVKTAFASSVSDADNIDRFDTFRIYETLKNEKFDELTYDEQFKICTRRIENLKNLYNLEFATNTGKALFHEKLAFQIEFYNRLKSQLEYSLEII